MIFLEDNCIKAGGVTLPGVVKSIEITREAAIDEVEVKGAAVKPKQAVGYEDATVKVELIIGDTTAEQAQAKAARIHTLFRPKGQKVPQPMPMVSAETAAAGISKVLFRQVTVKRESKSDLWTATLEFMEYAPLVITATKASSSSATGSVGLTDNYKQYLAQDRGTAPRLGDKTAGSPAVDDRAAPSR